jgi:hypothetical protein
MVREVAIDLPEERPLDIVASPAFGAYVGELRHALDHTEAMRTSREPASVAA